MKKLLCNKLPSLLLLAHLAIGLMFCLYISWGTTTLGGDTLEHIHSSWLVFANFIPYKDFFQHHNPLLWYMFSPLVGLHAKGIDDNVITSMVTSAAIIVSFINYGYLYLITSRFLSTKLGGLIAASIALTPYIVLSIIHFRPDNFMFATFFAGLYYYFCYLDRQKVWQLSLSFLLFWCSFMFLQKIVFTLLLLGFITLYLLYRKKIRFSDLVYASLLPICLSIGFVLYLYQNNILSIWYHSNFTFNLHIPELFGKRRIGTFWSELRLLLIGSICSILFCWKNSNIYFKILVIIFVSELCQRLFYFSAFAYYFCLLVYVSAILSAVFLIKKIFSRWELLIYILIASLYLCMYKPAIYEGNLGQRASRFYMPLNKEIVKLVTPCDYVLNGDGTIYNLYNRDPYYYWNLLGQTDVIGAKIGIYPLMDISEIIQRYKPRVITNAPYYDKYAKERGLDIIVHQPSEDLIKRYYKPLNSENLYILRPEFIPAKCDVDYKKRYYYAHD